MIILFTSFQRRLNCLAFQSFDFDRPCLMLFQKRILCSKFDIYVFIISAKEIIIYQIDQLALWLAKATMAGWADVCYLLTISNIELVSWCMINVWQSKWILINIVKKNLDVEWYHLSIESTHTNIPLLWISNENNKYL